MKLPLPRSRIFRSASLKLAAVYGLLFALSSYALVFFLWWATTGLLDQQVEAAIRADGQAFDERWSEGGLPTLMLAIQERLAENFDDDAIYSINAPNGKRIYGNLERWPANVVEPGVFYEVPLTRDGEKVVAIVTSYNLYGGAHLLVGRDVKGRLQFKRLLPGMLLYATILVAVLALFGSLVMRGLFRRMVADVSMTAAAISRGELDRRVRRSGRGDEFDSMAVAINTMLDRISRLMDGVRQVSNAIAHDLRTPIARARARLEDAASHANSEEELRAAVERAVADLDGVTAVFQALLRIAEIEAGSRRSAFAEIDLGPLLADLTDLYGAVAEDHGLTLVLRVPDTLPAYGDRDLVQQAVANLLDNAIKFSPSGGQVKLAAEPLERNVRITVTDQGPGIPEQDRARAAERFFRGEQARSTPGSGLGLALVQAVATLHEGALVLEDAGPGLRAVLTLRAVPPPRMNTPSSAPHGTDIAPVSEPVRS
ncbi:MAG TPA: HAMP domain-containing sensor histidine kinase [Acetobacteraceae bacterium]|nr:HAMP domain-containing sensor histidine kinase [Acetobacteraceae bacterium]